MAVKTERVLIM